MLNTIIELGPTAIVWAMSLCATAIGLIAAIKRYQVAKKRKLLLANDLSSRFVKQFNKKELSRFLGSYIVPHCSPSDPTNREGEEYLADIRESIFDYVDRTINGSGKSYQLLLADTGMGKTTFCLNYLAHAQRRFPNYNFALVSLSSQACDSHIKSVPNKTDTVLLADAFDEDPKGWEDGKSRLSEILTISEDFKAVIVTCRSQYFLADDTIPRETPLAVLVPRTLGQSQTFSLIRSYISPFSREEISKYLNRQFPRLYFWRWRARSNARQLIAAVPDLAYRPMLLERLPELARKRKISSEIFDLYLSLIDGWLERESRWIDQGRLRGVSLHLAVKMYLELRERRGRLKPNEIRQVAVEKLGESPDWTHLTSRSLLNRDSRGFFKFAHKSILEFLVVVAACEGDDEALNAEWTDFMREIFVSWGHSDFGKDSSHRARNMLVSPNGRTNIAPLYDPLDTSPIKGKPDFKRCAERRRTQRGIRLAPSSWRASAIRIDHSDTHDFMEIHDADYDLSWIYVPPSHGVDEESPEFRLIDLLNLYEEDNGFRAPSYEQFISLIEGLHKYGEELIPSGRLILIGDKPGRHAHLLVQLNSDPQESDYLKTIDKQRMIKGTDAYVNCYQTGISLSPNFSMRLRVSQLYLKSNGSKLIL